MKRRWEGICSQTSERRQIADDTWKEWQKMIQSHQDLQAWINERYSFLSPCFGVHSALVFRSLAIFDLDYGISEPKNRVKQQKMGEFSQKQV